MIRCVLFDLDGVVRHFDPGHLESVEQRHRLEPGLLQRAAFEHDLITRVTTGVITRAQWTVAIGDSVGSRSAAAEWLSGPATVDGEIVDLARQLRRDGLLTAILTNGTDTIPTEMSETGLDTEFDAIFNSAEIGVAKPHPNAFRHVCHELEVQPYEVFFTDDSPAKLAGAIELGMAAEPFTDVATLRTQLEKVRATGQS